MKHLLCLFLFVALHGGENILVVIAHPDDEVVMAGTLYRATHERDCTVDVVMITNGEGGFTYSTFAEPYYGVEIGRDNLPEIRRKEAEAGGKILGVREYTFLDQQDWRYTQDPYEPLDLWDVAWVEEQIAEKLPDYDYVFTMLPTSQTHGHHQAATILTLRALASLEEDERPTILALALRDVDFEALPGFPLTEMIQPDPIASFDRTQPVGEMNYHVPINWFIAEHKTQGTLQMLTGKYDHEYFYYFLINGIFRLPSCEKFLGTLQSK